MTTVSYGYILVIPKAAFHIISFCYSSWQQGLALYSIFISSNNCLDDSWWHTVINVDASLSALQPINLDNACHPPMWSKKEIEKNIFQAWINQLCRSILLSWHHVNNDEERYDCCLLLVSPLLTLCQSARDIQEVLVIAIMQIIYKTLLLKDFQSFTMGLTEIMDRIR